MVPGGGGRMGPLQFAEVNGLAGKPGPSPLPMGLLPCAGEPGSPLAMQSRPHFFLFIYLSFVALGTELYSRVSRRLGKHSTPELRSQPF